MGRTKAEALDSRKWPLADTKKGSEKGKKGAKKGANPESSLKI
jgi:hypothetical protein